MHSYPWPCCSSPSIKPWESHTHQRACLFTSCQHLTVLDTDTHTHTHSYTHSSLLPQMLPLTTHSQQARISRQILPGFISLSDHSIIVNSSSSSLQTHGPWSSPRPGSCRNCSSAELIRDYQYCQFCLLEDFLPIPHPPIPPPHPPPDPSTPSPTSRKC